MKAFVNERPSRVWDKMRRYDMSEFGEEWEAVELYPAESRLMDPSNRFYLWCAPKGVFSFGLPENGRRVWSSAISAAPQRPFPGEK